MNKQTMLGNMTNGIEYLMNGRKMRVSCFKN